MGATKETIFSALIKFKFRFEFLYVAIKFISLNQLC